MKDSIQNDYLIFDNFCAQGFKAGITLKGPWNNPDDVYNFIRSELMPGYMTLIAPEQVHGIDLVQIDKEIPEALFEADGVFSYRPDLCLTVTTADCLPLVFADPSSGYYGAVHVGWRSFIGGILEKLFEHARLMRMNLQTIRFFLGPGIGECCFEVGHEVAMLFDQPFVRNRDERFFVSIADAVRNKLECFGVTKENIGALHECTSCRKDIYYSYRRDKDTPLQMVTFIFKSA